MNYLTLQLLNPKEVELINVVMNQSELPWEDGKKTAGNHAAKEKINKQEETKTVIIRVEQLYPFPKELILESIKNYKEAYFVWCQEEPQNMGAWFFMSSEISEILEKNNFKNKKLYYSGRKSSASTATGLFKRHVIEQEELINSLFRDFKNE